MKFLLGQRLFNNIFCANYSVSKKQQTRKLNKRKLNRKNELNKIKYNFYNKIKYPEWYNNNY